MLRPTMPSLYRSHRRLPLVVVSLVALLCAGFSCGDPPPSGALAGTQAGLERWIVVFEGEPDLTEYRAALKEGPTQARAYLEKKRVETMQARAPLAEQLRTMSANVVDYWWMTNAITVELPADNVESLKVIPGVKEVRPDKLLQ
jgi:hypothetical protein